MSPSALARINLEGTLRHKGIALVEIFGRDGPEAEKAGHDLTYQAVHGTIQAPAMPLVPVADLLGPERAVVATLTALRQRDQGVGYVHERVVLDDAAHAGVAAIEPHFAARLATEVGSTREELTRVFAAQPTSHWTALGIDHDIPLVAVHEPYRRSPNYPAPTPSANPAETE